MARKKFRPLRVKFKLRVKVRAKNRKEATAKLSRILTDWLDSEHETFQDADGIVGDWVRNHLDKVKFGAENRFWSPRAKRDYVSGYFAWKNPNWAKGKAEKKAMLRRPWRTPAKGDAGHKVGFPLDYDSKPFTFKSIRNIAAGKRVVAYRGPDGRFARKPGRSR